MKIKFRKTTLVLVMSILFVFFVSDYTVAQHYNVSDLGDGIAMDINNNGQVVGTWEPDPQGLQQNFYWDSIRERESINLGGHGGFLGINDVGEAIQLNWFHPPKGRIWNSMNGAVIEIPIFPKAINDSAYVTGWTGGGPSGGDLAVVWDDTNGIHAIAGGINGNGNDVNDYGEVVGRYSDGGQLIGFIWDSSNGLQNIPTLGGDRAEALAINNLGQVVGVSEFSLTSTKSHAFLWNESNGIRDLDTLGYCPAETDFSSALDINILGQVVGSSCAKSVERPNGVNAVIWDETNGMTDLNTLIPSDSGWVLMSAYAINDSGQIVGHGTFNGGEQRAFLLTPIHDSDGDGIPDDQDTCPFSDLSETVVIDDCDSGVQNVLFEDGCTISDLISQYADDATNHDEFVSAVSHMTNYLKTGEIISGKDKGMIQNCAAKAAIP